MLRRPVRNGHRSRAGTLHGAMRLLTLCRDRWQLLAAGIVLTLLATLASLMVPLGIRALVDALSVADVRLLNLLAAGLLGLFVTQALFGIGGGYLLRLAGERVVNDFRRRIYAHLHTLGHRFYDLHRIGDLTSRITNDVGAVRTAATSALAEVLTTGLAVLGSAVILMALNWRVGLMLLVVVPAATVLSRHYGARVRDVSRDAQDRLADATAMAQETLSNIRVVIAFARHRWEVREYERALDRLYAVLKKRAWIVAVFSTLVQILFLAVVTSIFWYGGREVIAGRLTVGSLVAMLFYVINITQGIGGLSSLFASYSRAVGASDRLFELLDSEPSVPAPVGAAPISGRLTGDIRLEGVAFSYDGVSRVLDDVTVHARAGERVALVGPSGSGKSTILRLIPRYYDVERGRVLVDGVDVRRYPLDEFRRQVAVVSQDVELFNASISDNVRYGSPEASDAEVMAALEASNAAAFVADLPAGANTVVGERGVRLSGGQKQRIAIARALVSRSPMLLLDEATSSLDSDSESQVKEAIDRLMRGRTCVVIAHRLSTVADADRIYVVERGRIAQSGTHTELMGRGGTYARYVRRQFGAAAVRQGIAARQGDLVPARV